MWSPCTSRSPTAPRRAAGADVAAGLVAIVAASSAPPLAAAIRAEAAALAFTWAPLPGELAVVTPGHAHLSRAVLAALHARVTAAAGRVEQVRLGFAALAELAAALGDALRARAQVRLAAEPPAAKRARCAPRRRPRRRRRMHGRSGGGRGTAGGRNSDLVNETQNRGAPRPRATSAGGREPVGPRMRLQRSRSATASPGRGAWGVWGAISGPPIQLTA